MFFYGMGSGTLKKRERKREIKMSYLNLATEARLKEYLDINLLTTG